MYKIELFDKASRMFSDMRGVMAFITEFDMRLEGCVVVQNCTIVGLLCTMR